MVDNQDRLITRDKEYLTLCLQLSPSDLIPRLLHFVEFIPSGGVSS